MFTSQPTVLRPTSSTLMNVLFYYFTDFCCLHPFQCESGVRECINRILVCNGFPDCIDGSDETPASCKQLSAISVIGKTGPGHLGPADADSDSVPQAASGMIFVYISIGVIFGGIIVAVIVVCICRYKRRAVATEDYETEMTHIAKPLNNKASASRSNEYILTNNHHHHHPRNGFGSQSVSPSAMSDPTISSCSIPFDRNHVTGASSSSSNCVTLYRETLNPPPSPATACSVPNPRGGVEYCSSCAGGPVPSMASTLQSKRHRLRSKIHAPPPTPCSTDFFDDSDNYTDVTAPSSRRSYNTVPRRGYHPIRIYDQAGPYPPPPTPRSNYLSDDCFVSGPPSPGTERSFYHLQNPPPSPVEQSE